MPDKVGVTTKVELTGPFFTRNPGKTLRHNVMDMLDELAKWMEQETDSQIASHAGQMPFYTGWTAKANRGYTTSAKTGRHWTTWAAVGTVTAGMDAKNAIRTKAAAVSIEKRWHPWRNVKSGIYRSRPLIQASLAKGLE